MHSLKALAKDFDHKKTQLLQKYGSTEKTIDNEFEVERDHVESMHKQLTAIHKDLMKFDESIKGISEPLMRMSEVLVEFYGENEKYSMKGASFRNSALSIDMAVREHLERQKELYFNIEEILGKLNAIKKKIQQRDVSCLEMDKWKTELIKLTAKQSKDQSKLWDVEKKHDSHKEQFTKINSELIAEIRQIYSSRFNDFGAEYKLLVKQQRELFKSAAEAYKSMDVSDIDIPPTDLYSKLNFNPQAKPAQTSPTLVPTSATKPDETQSDDRPSQSGRRSSPGLKKSTDKPPARPAPRPVRSSTSNTPPEQNISPPITNEPLKESPPAVSPMSEEPFQ